MLRVRRNPRTGKPEWALVSRSKPERILKWFGTKKPSAAAVAAEERRVAYYKHGGA